MRGEDQKQGAMYSYVSMEQRISAEHPARQIRVLVDGALSRLDKKLEQLYSHMGRPSIAPERLLRASLLMVLSAEEQDIAIRVANLEAAQTVVSILQRYAECCAVIGKFESERVGVWYIHVGIPPHGGIMAGVR